MKTKIYDLIKNLLIESPELRDSDKKLQWEVCRRLGLTAFDQLSYDDFLAAPSFETIRRCRQKIQELHPELASSKRIRHLRKEIEAQKGTFIYREEIKTQTRLI